jgi:hypothetical protein
MGTSSACKWVNETRNGATRDELCIKAVAKAGGRHITIGELIEEFRGKVAGVVTAWQFSPSVKILTAKTENDASRAGDEPKVENGNAIIMDTMESSVCAEWGRI